MNDSAKVGLVVVVSAIFLVAAAFFIANLHFGGTFNPTTLSSSSLEAWKKALRCALPA